MLFKSTLLALLAVASAQQCGPKANSASCATGQSCSQYGYCGTTSAYTDSKTCLAAYSGSGSSCAKLVDSGDQVNCGPNYGNKVCGAGKCCSTAGWCAADAAHCGTSVCDQAHSGKGAVCGKTGLTASSTVTAKPKTTATRTSTKTVQTVTTKFNGPYASKVPEIDVCGAGSGAQNVSCPGAGINGYFYRCCSSHGHCGPKNDIQDESIYCGVVEAGCQDKYGSCNSKMAKPPLPTGTPGVSQAGDTCGPIVNKKCAAGLCCSGSNFCGTGEDFCGASNWCQSRWGHCS